MKEYVGMALNRKDTQTARNYKNLIRFFLRFFRYWGNKKELLEDLMRLNLSILCRRIFNAHIMDGTSWTIGQTKVHYLVLAVLIGKVAVPIYWEQLKKLGASRQDERESMLQASLRLFDLLGMTLLGDREYIGKKWFKLLKDSGLDFVIRLKWADNYDEVNQLQGRTYEGIYKCCRAKQKAD